jgi:hypothetical protein
MNHDGKAIAQIARDRAAALQVSAETVAEARKVVATAGMLGVDAAERLRKEWFNDVFGDRDNRDFKAASADPDGHFLEWLRERVLNPFHVTYRAVERAARRHGAEAAMKLATVVWQQEVAWAQRLRRDRNQRIAVLSAMFLREAVSNPFKAFGRIADAYADALTDDPDYARSACHDLTPSEIRERPESHDWTPLFLRISERAYRDILSEMSRTKLEALAERAARDEAKDLATLGTRRAAVSMLKSPLSRMAGVISSAIAAGLDSNDLVTAERRFAERLASGAIELPKGAFIPYREFLDFVAAEGAVAEPPLESEEELRIARVDCLDMAWLDQRVPEDFARFGALRKEKFENWKADVVAGVRPGPIDPVSDYGFFLIASAARD